MLRETTFWVGGWLMIALGVLLAGGLYLSGAGVEYADAWFGGALSVGFGAFFLYVARDEHRARLEYLTESEREFPERPGNRPS